MSHSGKNKDSSHVSATGAAGAAKDEGDAVIVDELGRRKWDKTLFEQRAKERLGTDRSATDEVELPGFLGRKKKKPKLTDDEYAKVVMAPLKARAEELDLEGKVNRRFLVSGTTPQNKQGGFYCEVCDCLVRDSSNWLDHLNGINHQKKLGMSMKMVRDAFKRKKREKEEARKNKHQEYSADLDERIQQRMEDAEREKKEKNEKKKQRKKERKEAEEKETSDGVDPEFAALMGFGGFGKK